MQGESLKLRILLVEIRHLIRRRETWASRELEIELAILESRLVEEEERRKVRTYTFASIGAVAVQVLWKVISGFLN